MKISSHFAESATFISAEKNSHSAWHELWQYRELFYFLAWRDILVRYKQTMVGAAWSVLKPVSLAIVFTLIFGKLAKLPSEDVPYPVLVFIAMLPWNFVSNAVIDGSNSLIDNANMLTKVYFPRLILPASAVIVTLIDSLISSAVLAVMMIWYGIVPDWRIIALPLFFLHAILSALGLVFLLSSLNIRYRDFRYVVPFIVQVSLYISPVGFSSSTVPESWRLVYSLNPLVGVIDGFRWSLLRGATHLFWPGYFLSLVVTILILLIGLVYFRKTEQYFADFV